MSDAAWLAERLGAVGLFATLRPDQLTWLAGRGSVREVPAGTVLARQGDPADGFHVVLAGRTDWSRHVGGREVHAVTLGPGEIFAELILLLDQPYPTTGRTAEDTTLFSVDPDGFWEMLGTCPQVLRGVVAVAVERAELHEGVSQQQARLLSLGTIAAGLAHELNNPASAARSASRALAEPLREAPRRAAQLGPQAVAELDALLDAPPVRPADEGPLERADREDALLDWLEEREVPQAAALAPLLADAGLERDALAARLAPEAVADAAAYLAAARTTRELAATLEDASERMSRLVGAMRTFSRMDSDHVAEPVDVREGLDATLTLLEGDVAARRVTVVRHDAPELAPVTASAGELNQVWANLLDNALRAAGDDGTVTVTTRADGPGGIAVEVADDGPGIPDEIALRVFEPFFTTRGVGEGTGLGLDLVRRVVAQHGGDVRFTSRPGETRFVVRLPAAGDG